jgi:hypothetical protein
MLSNVCENSGADRSRRKYNCKPLVLRRSKSSRHERAAAAKIGGPTSGGHFHGPRASHENPGADLRFVARASRRAASTVVSTFFSAVTAIRLEAQREINALPPIFDGAV